MARKIHNVRKRSKNDNRLISDTSPSLSATIFYAIKNGFKFSIFPIIGAIILYGMYFLAPRSIIVTIPLTGRSSELQQRAHSPQPACWSAAEIPFTGLRGQRANIKKAEFLVYSLFFDLIAIF
jgi:hypothetical protein